MKKKIAALLVIILATGFTLIGIYRGEVAVVLKKAVNICTECIGIG
ncbi:hypothetical protein E4O03_01970 [Treponema sp. OMZ 792]|nr:MULTISPECIES: CD1871A family CXXC motif-containing protein [unclassified Treponema]UTC75521.1 hypothetical protein E4O03_01970 [Treponema sp. OMZ 792]UTC78675.1 hypothetical protein E4O04_12005 [Treponema sp. OMZ 799]UTC79525.1 hypothetical protein E4O07_01985 [Treponema sp. OMZ 798]